MEARYLPIRIYVRYRDAKGHIASAYIHVAATTPYAQSFPYANDWADACIPVSGAEVIGHDIVANTKAMATPAPGPGSQAHRQGVLLFGTTEPEDRYIVEIPSIKEELLETTGEYAGVKIDITQPSVQALVDLLIDGNGTLAPIGMAGHDLTTLITAYQRRL